MANPYTDMRAITARLGQVQPRTATPTAGLPTSSSGSSEASIKLGRAANRFAIQNPELRAQIEAIAKGGESDKSSGFIGAVLGNPVVKVGLKGLEAFALPGRATVAGLREVADVFDKDENTRASFGDFVKNMKDSTYGFGKAFKIDTGNKWWDRAIGFIGDVALDPLTYATFGAGKAVGYGGRINLAKGVLRETGDNVLAKAVAIEGRKALRNNPEVLERLGANKFGVYFFGKRLKFGPKYNGALRLPMSGTIGEIGESTLSNIRRFATDTKLGQTFQKLTMPKDFLDLRLKLARGQLTPDAAADAIRLFDVIPAQRAAKAVARQALENELMTLLRSEGDNVESYRSTVYRFLENPALIDSASEAEKRAVAVWRSYLDSKWDDVSGRWKSVDEFAEIGKTNNYFPRVASDAGKQFMNSSNPFADDVRAIFLADPFDMPDSFTPRALRPGKKWFGKVLEPEDMNIESLNRIARENGKVDFDFFETDVVNVMSRYVQDVSDEIGLIERNRLLKESGFFDKIDEMRVTKTEVNPDEVRLARELVEEQKNVLDSAEQGFRKSVADLADAVRTEQAKLESGLKTSERLSQDMGRFLYDMLDDMARRADAIEAAKQRLIALWGPVGDIPMYSLSDDFPVMLRPVLAEYDGMVSDLREMSMIVSDLQAQTMKEGMTVEATRDALQQIEDAAAKTQAKLAEKNASINSAMEVANALEASWDSLVAGGAPRVDGLEAKDVVGNIRDILGMRAASTTKKQQEAVRKAVGVRGRLRSFLRGEISASATERELAAHKFFNEVLEEVSGGGQAGIKRSKVSEMKPERFMEIVFNVGSSDVTLTDLRVAAAYAMGRDIRLYGAGSVEELPEFVRKYHNDLKEILKEVGFDEEMRVRRANMSKEVQPQLDRLNARWGADYDFAVNLRTQIDEYDAVAETISTLYEVRRASGVADDVPFDEQIIAGIEEGASTITKSKGMSWLYGLFDDAEKVFGKPAEDVMLGDVLEYVQTLSSGAKRAFTEDTIEYESIISANLKQGDAVPSVNTKTGTRADLVRDFEAKVRQIEKRSPESKNGARYRKWEARRIRKAETLQKDMARSLVEYQAITDAVQKFEAIAAELAPHGLIPPPQMWRGILATTGKQYGEQFSNRFSRLASAEDAFMDFYNSFNKALHESKRLPKDEQTAVGILFREALENALNGPNGETLRDVVGKSMAGMYEPTDMRLRVKELESAITKAQTPAEREAAKQRYNKFVNDFVVPWAKEQDPTMRANKGPAVELLKDRMKNPESTTRTATRKSLSAMRTPMSVEATDADAYRWFREMTDTIDPSTGNVIGRGRIRSMMDDVFEQGRMFRRMTDGYLDVDSFFETLEGGLHTPAAYATQLIEWARVIQGSTNLSAPNPYLRSEEEAAELFESLGGEFVQAYRKGPKVDERAQREAAKAARVAQSARQVVDAMSNPELTLQELKDLGFTKAMVATREKVLELEALRATADYAKALENREMVDFLTAVAGVDFSQFTDGVIVGTRRVPKIAGDFVPETPEALAIKIDGIQQNLKRVDEEEAFSLRKLKEPYTVQKNGRTYFKDSANKKAFEQRRLKWQQLEKGQFDFKRAQLQNQLEAAEIERANYVQRVVVAPEYEDVPVFAKMPDGTTIKFSKEEWDSLYQRPTPPLGIRNLNTERRGLLAEIDELNTNVERLMNASGAAWDPAKKRYIRSLEKRIQSNEARIQQIDSEILRSSKDTRNVALEKLRILVHGITGDGTDAVKIHEWENISDQLLAKRVVSSGLTAKEATERKIQTLAGREVSESVSAPELKYAVAPEGGVGGAIRRGGINKTLMHHFGVAQRANPALNAIPQSWANVSGGLAERRAQVLSMWKEHPSFGVFTREAEINSELRAAKWGTMKDDSRMLDRAAREAERMANASQFAVGDVYRSMQKAVVEMRNREIQAARAAGAEFKLPGSEMFNYAPESFPYQEVEYVLNGKTYSVPSINDMLKDPIKYARRAQKRGDFFFDLKKPGSVVMWNEASENARAAAGLYALQNIMLKNDAGFFNAAVVEPSVARSNEAYLLMTQWSEDLKGLNEKINSVREALNAERQSAMTDYLDELENVGQFDTGVPINKRSPQKGNKKLDIFEFGAEVRAAMAEFDPSIPLSQAGMVQMESLVSALRKRLQLIEDVMRNMPDRASTKSMMTAKTAETRARWMSEHLAWVESTRSLLREVAKSDLTNPAEARIWNAFLQASAAEARFNLAQGKLGDAMTGLDSAKAGTYVDKVLQPATREFNKAAKSLLKSRGRVVAGKFNMPSYSVDASINEILNNVSRLNDAKTLREVGRFLGGYTGFFKAYATLSPGFHVRNSISNTFQLFAAGADVKNMNTGLKLWRSMGDHFRNGGTFESWLATVPEELRAQAKIAGEVTLGLGGGKTEDAFADFLKFSNNVLTDNALTNTSRKFGQKVEGSARFMLAFDSSVKDMDFTESFNRTRRFLIDYNDPTILDDTVRNIIPFWTWMSRNVPLQVMTQWTNPKPYLIYDKFAKNFKVDEDEQIPEYMRKMNPVAVGDSTYLTLDLPFMSTERTVEDLGDFRKTLSMLNPGIRVPMELAGGRQFFTGQEFGPDNSAAKYAATNLLPMLGQVERVTRTGEKSDELGLARYLGVPVRGTTQASRDSELMRRLYEIQNLVNREGGR